MQDADAAFMVGAFPRKEGMERKDLLTRNIDIFKVCNVIDAFVIVLSSNYIIKQVYA